MFVWGGLTICWIVSRRRDRGAEALQPLGQALVERAAVDRADRRRGRRRGRLAAAAASGGRDPAAAGREPGLLRDTPASAANSAWVGRGIRR